MADGWQFRLVAELPLAGKDHGHPVLVRCRDHVRVTDGPAGLDYRLDPRLDRLVDAVAEWEERIRAHYGARRVVTGGARLVNRQECRVHARHLSRADPD